MSKAVRAPLSAEAREAIALLESVPGSAFVPLGLTNECWGVWRWNDDGAGGQLHGPVFSVLVARELSDARQLTPIRGYLSRSKEARARRWQSGSP